MGTTTKNMVVTQAVTTATGEARRVGNGTGMDSMGCFIFVPYILRPPNGMPLWTENLHREVASFNTMARQGKAVSNLPPSCHVALMIFCRA